LFFFFNFLFFLEERSGGDLFRFGGGGGGRDEGVGIVWRNGCRADVVHFREVNDHACARGRVVGHF